MSNSDLIYDISLCDDIEVFERFQLVRAREKGVPEEISEFTMRDGVLHAIDDRPSYRRYVEATGQDIRLVWHKNGLEHNERKPSQLSYYRNGDLHLRAWSLDGVDHRVEGPCREMFDEKTGRLIEAEYKQYGKWYRPDGPVNMFFNRETGIRTEESWCTDPNIGSFHRQDGPARVYRDSSTGIAYLELWAQQGCLFRPDGLAPVIHRDRVSGRVMAEAWSHEIFRKQDAANFPQI